MLVETLLGDVEEKLRGAKKILQGYIKTVSSYVTNKTTTVIEYIEED